VTTDRSDAFSVIQTNLVKALKGSFS